MERQANSRQVPKTVEYTSEKKYSDLLYSCLQCMSMREGDSNFRYILKSEINFSSIAKDKLHLSRQTVSKRFKNLIELGLVVEEGDRYRLCLLDASVATLVPYDVLQILVDSLSDNAISTYVYLMNRFIANKEQPLLFTLGQIKAFAGLTTTTRSNDSVINNILVVLQKLGLIEYHMETVHLEDKFQNFKTNFILDNVRNKIK